MTRETIETAKMTEVTLLPDKNVLTLLGILIMNSALPGAVGIRLLEKAG